VASAGAAIIAAMPIYEYRCANGHAFEVFQSMSEDSLTECVECGAECERVLSAPAVHFKGSGFYTTDYARKGAKKAASDGGGESKDSGKKSESSDKGSTDSSSSKSSESASKSGSSD
jgi:putative FmdB family regulatory protein